MLKSHATIVKKLLNSPQVAAIAGKDEGVKDEG
jgi:hypothetical protein